MSDWDDLRRKAEAATSGPWEASEFFEWMVRTVRCVWTELGPLPHVVASGCGETHENAAYIAAASPDRILALLDENDARRRESELYAQAWSGWQQSLVERDRLRIVAAALEEENARLRKAGEVLFDVAEDARWSNGDGFLDDRLDDALAAWRAATNTTEGGACASG